jgi:AraC family transcriptional regulator, regulatory protein of adaptative response / methylated-DNA-[protein]-cysteine methyltransferase
LESKSAEPRPKGVVGVADGRGQAVATGTDGGEGRPPAVAPELDTADGRWRAVEQRDPAADGLFVYAVTSTGIYCRPTCPSRRPRQEHVRFFDGPEAAEAAGFRACRRCEPQSVNTGQRVVAEVARLLQTAERAPSLAALGQAVGMSPYHLQRLFKRATGLSPKQYAAAMAATRLKAELQQGTTVTGALYEAGYGSARAAYDQAGRHLGMTPGAYRAGGAGQRIRYSCVESPLGSVLVAATEKGLCAVRLGEETAMVAELATEFPRAELVKDVAGVQPYVEAILADAGPPATLPLDVRGTAFQQRVWEALRSIPYGQVRSYREVAEMIGEPTAVRAVARACASNPVALVIPCHRVVRSNGELSGYRWGVERKQELLRRERS